MLLIIVFYVLGLLSPTESTESNSYSKKCKFDAWTEWSKCSSTCGEGYSTRKETCVCDGKVVDDKECLSDYSSPKEQRKSCSLPPCCSIGEWSEWSNCSDSCDGGIQHRKKLCSCEKDSYGKPRTCESYFGAGFDLPVQHRTCNTQPCCNYSGFLEWSKCSKVCGTGTQSRREGCVCSDDAPHGSNCRKSQKRDPIVVHQQCNTDPCCSWEGWEEWTRCTAQCDGGTRKRYAGCTCKWADATPRDCYERIPTERPYETEACNDKACCGWKGMSEWSDCTKSCGSGIRTRHQVCECVWENATIDDCIKRFGKPTVEKETCNTQPCCNWTGWEEWSKCTKDCDGGTQSRKAGCLCSFNGFSVDDCVKRIPDERPVEVRTCNTNRCCLYSGFEEWSDCSVPCGGGYQTKKENCTCGPDLCFQYTGRPPIVLNQSCNTNICCKYEGFDEWSACSRECGGGIQTRKQTCRCVNGSQEGQKCPPEIPIEQRTCNTQTCCKWEATNEWGVCSKPCGGGFQERMSTCSCVYQNATIMDCMRLIPNQIIFESRSCNDQPCCTWEGWSDWSACSKSCDTGSRYRTEICQCTNGTTIEKCVQSLRREPLIEREPCNNQDCCKWVGWESWSDCTEPCGGGISKRFAACDCLLNDSSVKTCNDLIPGFRPLETRSCNDDSCCEWSGWNSWSTCSEQCGGGIRTRSETCTCKNDRFKCIEILGRKPLVEKESCNSQSCCYWDEWKEWSHCTKNCDGGHRKRVRDCKCNDKRSYEDCLKAMVAPQPVEEEACNLKSCCTWSSWSRWGKCSNHCGDGVKSRDRKCKCLDPRTNSDNKYHYFKDERCVGSSFEETECNDGPCSYY